MKSIVQLFHLIALQIIIFAVVPTALSGQVEIAKWTFTGDVLTPESGIGSASLVGGVSATFAAGVLGAPDRGWNTTSYPDQGMGNKLNGVQFSVSTLTLEGIQISFNIRHSNTAANTIIAQYSIDNGATFNDAQTITFVPQATGTGDTWFLRTLDLSSIQAINNLPVVVFRFVTAFDPANGTSYSAARSTSSYGGGGTIRYDNVEFQGSIITTPALPSIRITEYAYQGANGEFIEFTNVGTTPVDMSGWSYDDDSRIAGTVSLSAFGIVRPGESVILAEISAAAFRTAWNLCDSAKVIGNLTTNLGRNDEINLYDHEGNLIDRLTYGDQNFPGSVRTQNISGWVSEAGLGNNDAYAWILSSIGDIEESYTSTGGDIGNPGKSKRSTVNFDPCAPPLPTIRITEYAYQGANGEFIEFTNVGAHPVDMSGWSYDDDSRIAGTVPLSGFGIVQAGESVILAEVSASAFRTAWNLCENVKVIGNLTTNLGRNDEINLYDSEGNLHDRLTYGDQTFPGSIRTQNISGWVNDAGLGNNDAYAWTLSSIGDIEDSYTSTGGDIGNPGKSKRTTVVYNPCDISSDAPSISISTSTSIYILSNNPGSLNSPFAISGVINDPSDPMTQFGINFLIEDEIVPAENLIVTASSGNTTVVPHSNLLLTGQGNIRNLRISPSAVGFTTITLSVSNGETSSTFLINYAASSASNRPDSTFWLTGIADASTGVPVGSGYVIIADDESQALGLYNTNQSGQPINVFDFTSSLGLTDISGGIPREVDIEGSFRSGNRIFWIGSHGNGSEGQCRENRRRLFATDITGTGASAQLSYVGRYDLLREQLVTWGNSNGYNFSNSVTCGGSGVLPTNPAGFNIEGFALAPDGTTAFIGFRAPIVPPAERQFALIAPILNFESWFNNGSPLHAPSFGNPIELDLGGRAIRSLECNGFGCIIVAGNTNETGNFKIYTWTGNPSDAPRPRTADLSGLTPEGLVSVPDMPFTGNQANDFVLQLITDNGVADFYNNGQEAKALNENRHKKVRFDFIQLGQMDADAPIFTTDPQALTVECDGEGNEEDLIQWLQNNGGATAAIDCGAGTWTYEISSSSFDCPKGNCTQYTFTVTDECGFSASSSAEFCIKDTTPPVIFTLNPTITLNASGQYAVQTADIVNLENSFDQCSAFTIQDIQPLILNCSQVNTSVQLNFIATDACGNQSSHIAIITIEEGSELPENYNGINIGTGQGAVSYSPCNDSINFQISGTGFSSSQSDNMVGVSQSLCGNGTIIIHISEVTNMGWAGIHFRETNASGSKKAALKTQLTNRVFRETRTITNAAQTSQQMMTAGVRQWLKLERNGNQFVGYSSTDGFNWQMTFSALIPMNNCIEAGAFIESLSNGSPATATIKYFEIISSGFNSNLPVQIDQQTIQEVASLQISPNPVIQNVLVQINNQIEESPNLTLNIRNVTGQIIRKLIVENQTMSVSMGDYPSGIYILTLQNEQRILESCKIVKQ